jgi:hypothetical protein
VGRMSKIRGVWGSWLEWRTAGIEDLI